MSSPEVDLLTSAQVAELFGVTRKTVGIWARTGALRPAWKAPGKLGGYTFARADVERTLAERAAPIPHGVRRARDAPHDPRAPHRRPGPPRIDQGDGRMTYAMGTSEAATYAGVPADAIRDAITRGDLPAGRVGKRRLLIRRADLEAWVDSRIALGSQEGDDA